MTDLVKCTSCNLIIDELLCYVQQKISIADEVSLVRICASAFTSDEIKKSKALLYEALPTDKRKILRKNRGKEERDLADIINLFKSTEPDDIPVFVARQLHKLPPILWDHLDCSKMLKDLLIMKTEIEKIKIEYATRDSVQDIKNEVMRIRNDSLPPTSAFKVNKMRGTWLDSGPEGISHEDNNNGLINDFSNNKPHLLQYREMGVDDEIRRDYVDNEFERQRSPATESEQARTGVAGGGSPLLMSQLSSARVGTANASVTSSFLSYAAAGTTAPQVPDQLAPVTDQCESEQCSRPIAELRAASSLTNKNNDDLEGWQQVSRVSRRKQTQKYRFMGKAGVARDIECSFKAADRKIPMFITNIHSTTKECDIVQYIQNRTKESVSLEAINMRVQRGYKAYKFYILETNLPIYMDEKLWPAGIIFRRFANYRRKDMNQENIPAGGANKPNNG